MRVHLLYFAGCPNVDRARANLQRALRASGAKATVEEIDTTSAGTAERLRSWGSPTILVDGFDVAGEAKADGAACRLYGAQGTPPEDVILTAILRARKGRWGAWLRSLALVPGAVLPLLPSFACPACLAAYAGLLSALGVGVLLTERVLVPLIVAFLVVGVLSVGWATQGHRKPGPLVATVGGSLAVVLGRLVWSVPPVLYAGVGLLVTASLWNLWLKRPRPEPLIHIRPLAAKGDAR